MPVSETGPSLFQRLQFDKLIHCGIFAGFSFLWIRACSWRSIGVITVAGVILSILSELGQATSIVNRDANVWDGLADIIGVGMGIWMAHLLTRHLTNSKALTQ